jgi:hypothetical protein
VQPNFSMNLKLAFALIYWGSCSFLIHTSNAAQAPAVASNGKWALALDHKNDITDVSAKAIADCKAKGGVDPKIVWSVWTNIWGTTWKIYPGAVAVSDNGNGTIVGWHFGHSQNHRLAKNDCLKKGGQHPKVVDIRN